MNRVLGGGQRCNCAVIRGDPGENLTLVIPRRYRGVRGMVAAWQRIDVPGMLMAGMLRCLKYLQDFCAREGQA